MIHWAWGKVLRSVHCRDRVQEVLVAIETPEGLKTESAIHYTDVHPPVEEGDRVLLNTTAEELALGSGGSHFVCAVREKDADLSAERRTGSAGSKLNRQSGHLMKLRYTPYQRAVLAVEEEASAHHAVFMSDRRLDGIPVLIGELHSMLPISLCWLEHLWGKASGAAGGQERPLRVVYVMTDGGALPFAYSRHAATLRRMGWIDGTVTYGHAYGGELEAINKYTALIAARHVLKADLIVVCMGPGIAGTGTRLGHSGVEVGELVNAAAALDGQPIVIPRISFAERRTRHFGLSQHSLASLAQIARNPALLPLPGGLAPEWSKLLSAQLAECDISARHEISWSGPIASEDIEAALDRYPLPITTMGRGFAQDPEFFRAVCAAAQAAWENAGAGRR